jgi:small-conductance mechanosensitive channel
MHFPLVGPYAEWHTIVTCALLVILFVAMCCYLASGYEEKYDEQKKEYFRMAHICAGLMIPIPFIGVWTVAAVLSGLVVFALYKLGQSVMYTYDLNRKSDASTSSSTPSRNKPYQGW